jgi:chromosome segregation ATPase
MHRTWVSQQEVKDVRATSKTFENEIERLKNRLKHREAVEAELLSRIRSLTDEVDYWKGYFSERFVQ